MPDSWHALLNKKYKRRISLENIPTDVMAIAARATHAEAVLDDDGRDLAGEGFLKEFKPNVLKLASQNNEVVRALADGSAWIGITNLGTDDRVKDAGGPVVRPAYPREERSAYHRLGADRQGLEEQGELREVHQHGRAGAVDREELPHERPSALQREGLEDARQSGHGDRAKRLLYNQPEKALKMTIKGPAGDEQAYVDAFNEVFGA